MASQKKITDQKIAVVVLGMHRSGTSALAGILAKLGCTKPAHLMPENQFNPLGYFESMKVQYFNDLILECGGSSWLDWQAFNKNWMTSPQAKKYLEQGAKTLSDEFGDSPLFLLKDPRMCRLLEFWLALFEREKIKPVFVITHRNPFEVSKSLAHREDWPDTYGLLLWLRHVLEAEFYTRGALRSFTSFDRILKDWRTEITKIEKASGFTFPGMSYQASTDIAGFLNGDLKNNAVPKSKVLSDPMFPKWVLRSFEILEKWAEHGEDVTDHGTLDDIRAEFDAATPILAELVNGFLRNATDHKARIKEREEALQLLRLEMKDKDERFGQMEKDILKLRGNSLEVEGLRRDLQNAKAKAIELENDLSKREWTLEELREELDNVKRAKRLDRIAAQEHLETMLAVNLRMVLLKKLELQTHIQEMKVQNNAKISDYEAHIQEISDQYEEEAKEYRDQIAYLDSYKSNLLNSSSWRITAPIRKISKILRR